MQNPNVQITGNANVSGNLSVNGGLTLSGPNSVQPATTPAPSGAIRMNKISPHQIAPGNLALSGLHLVPAGAQHGDIRCPICGQMGYEGLAIGTPKTVLACSSCAMAAMATIAGTFAEHMFPQDSFKVYRAQALDHSPEAILKVTNWACWRNQAGAYVVDTAGKRWDLPVMGSGVDSRDHGNLPICKTCPNQLACLTGPSIHDKASWDLVLTRKGTTVILEPT